MKLDGALADLLAMVHTYGTIDPSVPSRVAISPAARLPEDRLGWDFSHIPPVANATESAVLVLFGSLDDHPADYHRTTIPEDLDLLLTQRAITLRKHPGQISFPGGKRDATDVSPAMCALREAEEETNVDPTGIQVLGQLGEVPLSVSNFMVTPVIGWWSRPSEVNVVDDNEATRVFRVPVADLVNPDNRVTTVSHRHGRAFRAPAFVVADTLVWGFTAILIDRMLDLLGWSQPWDRGRTIDVTDWDATQPVPPIRYR